MNLSLSKGRYREIRDCVNMIEEELSDQWLEIELERRGVKNLEDAIKLSAHVETEEEMIQFLRRSVVMREVSKIMFEVDLLKDFDQQNKVVERLVNSYYKWDMGDNTFRSHVHTEHGEKPAEEIYNRCVAKKLTAFEGEINKIARNTYRWMTMRRSRVFTDPNCLKMDEDSSGLSERKVITRRENLTAVKAQRDLLNKFLENSTGPYLAIHLHGKVDARGHDFEIGAKQLNGKGPIHPYLAFWIQEKLREKVEEYNLLGVDGGMATVNVVASKGNYSGSPANIRLRYGDGLFGFEGFGERVQVLQLECSKFLRKNFTVELSLILNDLMQEFSDTFTEMEDIKKMDRYSGLFELKKEMEAKERFMREKLMFDDDLDENVIEMRSSDREVLGVNVGDMISCYGVSLTVGKMKMVNI